jgi:hypothetical protein
MSIIPLDLGNFLLKFHWVAFLCWRNSVMHQTWALSPPEIKALRQQNTWGREAVLEAKKTQAMGFTSWHRGHGHQPLCSKHNPRCLLLKLLRGLCMALALYMGPSKSSSHPDTVALCMVPSCSLSWYHPLFSGFQCSSVSNNRPPLKMASSCNLWDMRSYEMDLFSNGGLQCRRNYCHTKPLHWIYGL